MTDLPGLDLAKLHDYLAEAAPGLVAGNLNAELIAGGRSNLTYRLTDGIHDWVVRRPPLGHVLATAHDMGREFRVLSALNPTTIPTPRPIVLCTDPAVLGAPFYVMEHMSGAVLRSRTDMVRLGADKCQGIGHQLIDVLADLHMINPESLGLGDFGKPEGYLARQVVRWRKQLDASRSRTVAGIDHLHDLLASSVPSSARYSLLHGDYRLDNVLIQTNEPKLTAVLDWEMATLGDPLADLGLFVIYLRDHGPGDTVTGRVTSAPGFPTADDLVQRYTERTGIDISTLDWYIGLGCFKLAVVLEGIHYRFVHGKTVGRGFERIGEMVPNLVRGGLAALGEDTTETVN